MSKRARPRQGTWRPPRPRKEIAKAVAAAGVILGGTAGIIYAWPTGSGGGTTPATTVTTSKPKKTTTTTRPKSTTTVSRAGTPSTTTSAPATTTTKDGAGR